MIPSYRICIELRFLCWEMLFPGDLIMAEGERERLPRPGIRLSIGDMGLVPRAGTERPSTGERLWVPGEADLVMFRPRSGRRSVGSGGGQEVPRSPVRSVSSLARAARLLRAVLGPWGWLELSGTFSQLATSSDTLEISSARVKPGLEVMGPEVDLSMLILARWERLYSMLEF